MRSFKGRVALAKVFRLGVSLFSTEFTRTYSQTVLYKKDVILVILQSFEKLLSYSICVLCAIPLLRGFGEY